MSYSPRNVLVTGGAGFIGANYVRWLLGEDAQVRIVNLDALTYAGSPDNLQGLPGEERYHFVQGDICDVARVRHRHRHALCCRWISVESFETGIVSTVNWYLGISKKIISNWDECLSAQMMSFK